MSALEENQEWEAVNRIVFPTTDAESTLPLYVVNWTPSHPDPALFDARESLEKVAFSSLSKRQLSGTLRNGIFSAQEASKTELPAGSVLIKSRTSIELAAGQHVSLCTFFNAFPASYWQRWTKVTNVRFIAKVGGVGRIVVMKSSARGIPLLLPQFLWHKKMNSSKPTLAYLASWMADSFGPIWNLLRMTL
ncbi:MAG: hypothetical protein ACLUA4_11290 [Bifidobacterium sp.]